MAEPDIENILDELTKVQDLGIKVMACAKENSSIVEELFKSNVRLLNTALTLEAVLTGLNKPKGH